MDMKIGFEFIFIHLTIENFTSDMFLYTKIVCFSQALP
jgi:ABC-type multidrug transport system permease subunit